MHGGLGFISSIKFFSLNIILFFCFLIGCLITAFVLPVEHRFFNRYLYCFLMGACMDVVTMYPLHLYTFLSASLCKLLSMYFGSLCKRICSKTTALSFHLCSVLFLSFLSVQVQKYPDKPSINRVYFLSSVCCNSSILRLTVSYGCVLFHPR